MRISTIRADDPDLRPDILRQLLTDEFGSWDDWSKMRVSGLRTGFYGMDGFLNQFVKSLLDTTDHTRSFYHTLLAITSRFCEQFAVAVEKYMKVSRVCPFKQRFTHVHSRPLVRVTRLTSLYRMTPTAMMPRALALLRDTARRNMTTSTSTMVVETAPVLRNRSAMMVAKPVCRLTIKYLAYINRIYLEEHTSHHSSTPGTSGQNDDGKSGTLSYNKYFAYNN